jgi:two-component system chemotaxis response regulator CheY
MSSSVFENLKVLIVDDNVHMRVLLRRLLGTLSIRDLHEATDGQAGMAMLRGSKFDLVLTDLEMSPMNGLEFTRELRNSADDSTALLPIIMVSGHTEIHKVQAARDAGVTEFIVKPITARSLFSRITEITERPRPFVRCAGYAGPDRRRRNLENYAGPWRREGDPQG